MRCKVCGKHRRPGAGTSSKTRVCSECWRPKGQQHNQQAAQPAPSGNVKRVRSKARTRKQAFTMLANLPPVNETYGVVMRERSQG